MHALPRYCSMHVMYGQSSSRNRSSGFSLQGVVHFLLQESRAISSTLLYVEIEEELYGESPDGKFICDIAQNPEEAKKLIEEGFEYVGEIHGEPMFRKRK